MRRGPIQVRFPETHPGVRAEDTSGALGGCRHVAIEKQLVP